MFKNAYNVSELVMIGKTHFYCPLGNDYYTANFTIKVCNPKTIPDYCDVTRHFQNLDGKEFIIEQACHEIAEYICTQTSSADKISVTAKVSDALHLPVEVTVSK